MVKPIRLLTAFIVCFIWCSLYNPINAQNLWVVNNDPSFMGEDFDNLQTAIDSASPGDKIYVMGSPNTYSGIVVNKRVHLIGNGYWRVDNMIEGPNGNHSHIDDFRVVASGDSSIIEGFYITNTTSGFPSAKLNTAGHVVFRYNRVLGYILFEGGACVNDMIYGNYATKGICGAAINAQVFNNIFIDGDGGNFWCGSSGNSNCVMQNNVLVREATSSIANCTFRNNIVLSSDFSFSSGSVEYNVFVDDDVILNGIPTDSIGNGNIDSVDVATVFNLGNLSPDGKYQLIGDPMSNPAFGAGLNGEDCGAFGGVSPYRLSGIVKIPSITLVYVPIVGDTTNKLPVLIKARSN